LHLWAAQHNFQGEPKAVTADAPNPAMPAASGGTPPPQITLAEFQQLIRRMYLEKDVARGAEGTFMWLMEEVGELASALRNGTHQQRASEFADVLAWLATIANVAGVDLTEAVLQKYGSGCPGCRGLVCTCPDAGKP
jgi:NTP pyrophosphatase (non-canonical NTP hydrolase)